jgi:uncharacterized protein (DUF342 family)
MIDEDEALRPKHVAFNIEVDKSSGTVFGVLVAADGSSKLTRSVVDKALLKAGVFHWAKDSRKVNILVNNFNRQMPSRIAISMRKDASFDVVLSPDNMEAYIDVRPAQGGVNLTVEDLTGELVSNLVSSERIDLNSLNQVLAAAEEERITVAHGKPAIQGVDSQFKSLVAGHDYTAAVMAEDQYGSIDYWTGKTYVTVEPLAPIMERVPPRQGEDGVDIFGQILPSSPGSEISYAPNLKMPGTVFDTENPEVLLAEITGHPVFFRDGVRVDASLEFEKIDLTTGHVTFDGSVFVKGDVRVDMKINATGDVFIKGVVERAQVKAGNDITVLGGILGDSQIEIPEDGLPVYECVLEADGSIAAKYVNLASLSAGEDIIVKEYVFNSKLKSGNNVGIGQNGGKGKLVGGETHAVESVIAKTMGSEAYNITKIFLGSSKTILDALEKLNHIREQRANQARQLRELLPADDADNEDDSPIERSEDELNRIQKIEGTLLKLKDDMNEIDRRRKQTILGEDADPQPFISATSACFPNCYLNINGVRERVKTEHKAIAYVKKYSRIAVRL